MTSSTLRSLIEEARACRHCDLELGPRPVFRVAPGARILVAGQAPGRVVHESGLPFADRSGDRLRDWMGLDRQRFDDPALVAILPMAFCYPGAGPSGDRPPPRDCARLWRRRFLAELGDFRLSLVIGAHAMAWHLPDRPGSVTETLRAWRRYAPAIVPLPHPSPRNAHWLRRNPFFEQEVLPELRRLVALALA